MPTIHMHTSSAVTRRSVLILALLCVGFLPGTPSHAQFGPPEPQGSGPKLNPPTVFPPPGTYPTTESIALLDDDPQATIHYTFDGSTPTSKSPVFDPQQVLFIYGIYDGDHGLKTGYTIRAVAMHEGRTNSEVANFQFVIDRRDRTTYISEEVLPGVRMVRDADNDKMFLVKGANKYALIDSGMGRGDLKAYLSQFTGGMPIEVIFTHSHGDHIGQADQFARDSVEHIGEADLPVLKDLLKKRGIPDDLIEQHALRLHDGDRIGLGDRSLVVYETPGHTPGSMVVFDEQTGNLFTGDSFGSNSPTIPDALFMQWNQKPLDEYLSVVKNCRPKFRGRVERIMTGHNDHPLVGEKYLDNLEIALQSLMDKGQGALMPSYRPVGFEQVIVGDRLHDPNWVAINVNTNAYLPAAVEKIAGLTYLAVEGEKLSPTFRPNTKEYRVTIPRGARSLKITAQPTSSRSRQMTIDGEPVLAGVPHEVKLERRSPSIHIRVVSPDGTETAQYTVTEEP
ncbi:MAG TPA: MBL fold metallo-hydrolase [Terriglobales bacterium]|nr:MBL fold metallo-hydrolase [Terriglobales bacterium]